MGYRESGLVSGDVEPSLREVDIVFPVHEHRNIEFRLEKEWVAMDKRHEVRIFSDVYSQIWDEGDSKVSWEEYKPVLVQTASCGLDGIHDKDPPYFRKTTVDGTGKIIDFRVRDKEGIVDFKGAQDM